MKLLILGENCLLNLSSFDKSIFSTFSFITSIYARQLAAVTPKKHTVEILENNEDINYNEELDAVHIHFKTATALKAYKIADKFKESGKTVILSGAHTSALPEEAKKHADSVIIGNAEYLWPIVIKDLEKDKLKSFYKIKDQIDQIPLSSADIATSSDIKIMGVVEATRGCPYKCDFCQESNILHGSNFRTRPIEDVIKEIKLLPQKFLFFCDVSMTIDVSYTKALFKRMKNLNKKFVCEGNVDVIAKDEELLKLSHEAGCIEWTVGFESFAQQTLDEAHKKTNKVDDFTLVVEKIHKYNMAILGNFIFGFDHDTLDVFEYTEERVNELGLDSARFAVLTPYPGTPLFQRLEEEGRILTRDWSKYTRKNVVFEPKNMSKDDLEKGFIKISSNFNSIPNIIHRDLRSLKLGFYPFSATFGRNLESYMNRPGKWG
jgi:radical SAM superfamily enzyme YgiQ (UPF0313 family)